ncbi:hypothetical protein [Acinetobacter bereziniae]|uniref:hypothetical protein n=1 Tax=Acinetobacter bereziniae TaxID=106648 RepID=UPI00300ADD65
MASTKGKIIRLFSRFALERATVLSVEAFGGFQLVRLRSTIDGYAAGTKVQLLLPSDEVRTYTPIRHPEGMLLLGWKHADGPGARWLAEVQPGAIIPFIGPQRSLSIDDSPIVLVGDETSVAVAAALSIERPGFVHAVIQSDAPSDVCLAAKAVGLDNVDVVLRADINAIVDAVSDRLSVVRNSVVVLTGCSDLIVAVRDRLRSGGVQNIKTKTYWIPGKVGLD